VPPHCRNQKYFPGHFLTEEYWCFSESDFSIPN